ncbi:tetratricopeptide repeat protein [Geminocystis herdmanii]|uniref:tetratricopeptide repeat protein n=1 Tax=Geminocystis herdmanii TaxID=669359 RepID=UPI00034537CC|nr:tetratricopeptide repeat protein [Geminocystis herdmanii]
MFEEVKSAIDQENYDEAKDILTQLLAQGKNDLWIRYYQTLILEKQGNLTESEASYRQIVKDSIYPDAQLLKLIRDGIERIVTINREKQQIQQQIQLKKLQEFQNIENSEDLAVLVLKPVNLEQKKVLAPKFAQVMNLDNYTATLQIPTRSLRLYKTGNFGTLNYYQTELSQAEIPCFCQRIKNINQMTVYQVEYIISDDGEVNILCKNDQEKEIIITFQWTEINHKIHALIPIFEETLHIDAKGKPQKKKSTLDYSKFYDLHLVSQNLILRFSDQFYKFDRAAPFHDRGLEISKQGKTVQEKWEYLTNFLNEKIPDKPLWSDFTLFAEGAIQFPEMLKQITPHINLFRREETLWDETFQLYSGLIFFLINPS